MKHPNPDRIYAAVAAILEHRYDLKIKYDLLLKGEKP